MYQRILSAILAVSMVIYSPYSSAANSNGNNNNGGRGSSNGGENGSSSGGRSSSSGGENGSSGGRSSSSGGENGSSGGRSSSSGGENGSSGGRSSSSGGENGSSGGRSSSSGGENGSSSGRGGSSSGGHSSSGGSSGGKSSSGGEHGSSSGGHSSSGGSSGGKSSSGGEHGSSSGGHSSSGGSSGGHSSSSGGENGSGSSSGGHSSSGGSSSGGHSSSSSGGSSSGGSSSGGSSSGGSSSGGSSSGGSSSGGSSSGGSSSGGSSSGGSSSGGSSSGGSSSGGSSSGGSSSGGSSSSGSSSGGEEGGSSSSSSSSGGSSSSSSSGGDVVKKEEERKKAELKFKWQPAFYLDFDMGLKVTNLTTHNAALALQQNGSVNSLVVGDYKSGFRVEKYNMFEGGIGVSGHWWYENATDYRQYLQAYVGLMPIRGSKINTVQYAATQAAISTLPNVNTPPLKASDLTAWAVGDSANFNTSGGIMFFGGIGYVPLATGVTSIAKGTWSTFVQKTSPTSAYVKITSGKLDSLSVAAAGAFTSLGVSQFNNADQSFSYLMDIQSEAGQRAYEDLVRGNIAAVQRFVEMNKVARQIDTQTVAQKGKFFNFFIGIPILMNSTFSDGTITSLEKTDLKIDNSKIDVNYGIYTQEQRNKFLDMHSVKSTVFYGAAYTITDKTGKSSGFFGKLTLDFADDSASSRNMKLFVADVVRKTGLLKEASVIVPSSQDLQYSAAHLEMTFSQKETERMMDYATAVSADKFVTVGMTPYNSYNRNKDPYDVCPSSQRDYFACLEETRTKAENALRSMHKALRVMAANKNNPAEFTKAYAQFGRGVVENAFTVQGALTVAGSGVEVYYRLEGAKVSMFEKFMVSGEAGTMKILSEAGQPVPTFLPNSSADRQRGLLIAPGMPVYSPVNP